LRQESPNRSLLFVAHRKEILDQALRIYREVLGEGTFGELYTSRMRALGFCVSVTHAQYMARVFTEAGIPSRALSGETPLSARVQAATALLHAEIRCLFTVDLFDEGVDLPEVDTLLLLRPTSSATLFLQQLGRGLRRTPGKAVLTVLDFIGQHRREYRFLPRVDRNVAQPIMSRDRTRIPFLALGIAIGARPGSPRHRARQCPWCAVSVSTRPAC
jgi:superfamily II DNA or RNA helicase